MFFCWNYFVFFFLQICLNHMYFHFCFLLLSINWNYHTMCVYVGHTAELFYLQVK